MKVMLMCNGNGLDLSFAHHRKLEVGKWYKAQINSSSDLSIYSLDDVWIGCYRKDHFSFLSDIRNDKLRSLGI